jgi:hypothetical protein
MHMTDKNTSVLQSSTDAPRLDHGLCSGTSVWSSDDGIEVISKKIEEGEEEEVRVKEEDEPSAISFSSIKEEPEVSPQIFRRYLELPSLTMLLSVFHST